MKEEKVYDSEEVWSTHRFSELSSSNDSELLSFRSEPIKGESLYSWLTRVARENFGSIHIIFTKYEKNITRPARLDYI